MSRTGSTAVLLTALADNGGMARSEAASSFPSYSAFRTQVCRLKKLGLIRELIVITAEGREALEQFEIDAPYRRNRRLK